MTYCIIFEGDEANFGEEREIKNIQMGNYSMTVDARLVKLPPKMPMNYYDFETYTTGYAKGFNDFHDRLTGEYNNYKPEKEVNNDES